VCTFAAAAEVTVRSSAEVTYFEVTFTGTSIVSMLALSTGILTSSLDYLEKVAYVYLEVEFASLRVSANL